MSASCSARSALMVSRSGSPGPAPTSVTLPSALPSALAPAKAAGSAISFSAFSASSLRPASTSAPIGPSITRSQKRRRNGNSGMRACIDLRKLPMKAARSPMRAGSTASMRSRTRRATTGDVPPVPTATTTSPRSTIAGKIKVECARSSITLTGSPTALARADIATPMSPAPAQRMAMTPARSAASGSPEAGSIRAASVASRPARS